jgi:EPS-associated MarR family transcriptional regulator
MDSSVKIFDSEKTLHVLQEIERNPKVTQRGLAQKLEISLGKLNFLIRSLIDKGVIEIKNFKNSKNKLAYMYLLTPAGIKIKIQLTRKFFIWKTQEYEKLKEEIEHLGKEATVILPEEESV